MRSETRGLLVVALAALASACRSTGAIPRPFPTPGVRPPATISAPAAHQPADSSTLTSTALSLLGAPYRNGGSDPAGFDCSGFTQYVFGLHGIALPRDVKDQFGSGRRVKPAAIGPGDLIFFRTTARGVSHVGIALGPDEFIHAPSSTGVVRLERLSAAYWSRRLIGARRITRRS